MFESSLIDINDKFLDAAIRGDKRKVKKYLSKGVNVDCVNLNGQTALYLSVLDSRKELVEILLKHAADPNFRTLEGTTPLHMAVYKGDLHIVSYLIEAGGDLRLHDFKGKSIYEWAEKQKDVKKKRDVLDFLEKKKLSAININSASSYKETTAILNKTLDYKTISSWKPLSLMKKKVKSQSSFFSSTILSDGFGKIMLNNGEETSGVVGPIPLVSLTDLRHDSFGYTWTNGPFTVMESMLWKEEPITLKRLHTEPRQGGHVDLLINELKHLLELRHSSLLLLMGTCRSEDLSNLMLVFERIHTGSLFAFMHQKKDSFTDWEGCRLLSQVCEGVMYLHRKHRIHCNITSHSIFVVRKDLAKLGNFEYMVKSVTSTCSAANLSSFSNLSSTCFALTPNQVVNNRHTNGVYNWMSPEIMSGRTATTSSDLYSLCCVLWEVLHGQIPWKNQSANQIAHKILDEGKSLHSCGEPETMNNSGEFFKATLTFGLSLDSSDRQITLSQLQNQLALYVKDHVRTDAHSLFSTWSPPKRPSWRTRMLNGPSRPPRKEMEHFPPPEKKIEYTPPKHQEPSADEVKHDKPNSARLIDSYIRKPGRFIEGPPLNELRAQECLQSKVEKTTVKPAFHNKTQPMFHEDIAVKKEEVRPKLTFNISDIERALGERKSEVKKVELKEECKEKSFVKSFKLNSSAIGHFFSKMSHSRDSSFKYQPSGQSVLAKCQKFVTKKLAKKEISSERVVEKRERYKSTLKTIDNTTLSEVGALEALPQVPITLENVSLHGEHMPAANNDDEVQEDGFNVASYVDKHKTLGCKSEDTKLNFDKYDELESNTKGISSYHHKSENEISKEFVNLNFKSSIQGEAVKTFGNATNKIQESGSIGRYSSIYNPAKRAFFNLTPVSEFKNNTDSDITKNDKIIDDDKIPPKNFTIEKKITQKNSTMVRSPPSKSNRLENAVATLKKDDDTPTNKPALNKTSFRVEVDPKKKRLSGMEMLASSLTSPIKPKPRHSPSPRQLDAPAARKDDNNVNVSYIPLGNVHQKFSLPYKKDNHSFYLNPRPFYKNKTSISVHKRPLTTFERLERDLKKETENFIEGKAENTENGVCKSEMDDAWCANTISCDIKPINTTGTKKSLYFKAVLDRDALGLSPLQVHLNVDEDMRPIKATDIEVSENRKETKLVDTNGIDNYEEATYKKLPTEEAPGTANSTIGAPHISTSELNYVFANINQFSSQSEQNNKYLKIPRFNDIFVQTDVGVQKKSDLGLNDKEIDSNETCHRPTDNINEQLKMNSSSVKNKKINSEFDAPKGVTSSVVTGLNETTAKSFVNVDPHVVELQKDLLYVEAKKEFEQMNHTDFKDFLNLEYKYKLEQNLKSNKFDMKFNESFNTCALKSFSCTETDRQSDQVCELPMTASDSRIQNKEFFSPSNTTQSSSECFEGNYVILNENVPWTQRAVMKKTTSPYSRSSTGQSKPFERTSTYKENLSSFRKCTQKYTKGSSKSKDSSVISQLSISPTSELNSRKRIFDASLSELKSVMSQKSTLGCKRSKGEVSVEKQVDDQESQPRSQNFVKPVENVVKDDHNSINRRASNSHQGAIETLKMALQNTIIYNESLSKGVYNNEAHTHRACKPAPTHRKPIKMSPFSSPSFHQFSPPTFQQYSPFPFGPSDNTLCGSKPASHFSCKSRNHLKSPRTGMCSMVEIDTRPHFGGQATFYADALNNTRFSKSSSEVYREMTSYDHDEEKPPLQEIVKNFEEKMLEHVKMQSILIRNKKKTEKSDSLEATTETKQKLGQQQSSRHKAHVDQNFKPTHKSFVFANITPINSPLSLSNHSSHQPPRQEEASKTRRNDRFHVASEPMTSVKPLSCHSSTFASPIQPMTHTSKLSIQVRPMKQGPSPDTTTKPKTPLLKNHTTTLVITAGNENFSQSSIVEKANLQQQIKQQQQQILQIQQQQQQIQEQQQQLKEKQTSKPSISAHKAKVEDNVKTEAQNALETVQKPSKNNDKDDKPEPIIETIIEPLKKINVETPNDLIAKSHNHLAVVSGETSSLKASATSSADKSSVQEHGGPLNDGNTDATAASSGGRLSGCVVEGGADVGKQDDVAMKGGELEEVSGENEGGKPGCHAAPNIKEIIEELNKKTTEWKGERSNKTENNINNVNNVGSVDPNNRLDGSYGTLSNSQCTVYSMDTSDKTLVNSCFSSYNTMYNSNQSNVTLTTDWREDSVDVMKSRSTGTVVDDDIVEGKGLSRKNSVKKHVMSSDSDMLNGKRKFSVKDIPVSGGIGVIMGTKDVFQDNYNCNFFTTEVNIEYDMGACKETGEKKNSGCISKYPTEGIKKSGDLFNLANKNVGSCAADSFSIMKRFEEDLRKDYEKFGEEKSFKRPTESDVGKHFHQFMQKSGDEGCRIVGQSVEMHDDRDDSCKDDASRFIRWNFE